MFTIYKLTNHVTGMSYIGITSQPLPNRLSHHRKVASWGAPPPLACAIREYGWDAFAVETLGIAESKADAGQKERAAIVLFGTLVPHGYNLSPGGDVKPPTSLATREKLRDAGKRQFAAGRVLKATHEGQLKSARTRSGGNNWGARPIYFDGREYPCIQTAMTATGLSRSQIMRRIAAGFGRYLTESKRGPEFGKWNTGKTASADTRRKLSEARSGSKHYRARAIEVDGQAYPSITEAAAQSGYSYMQLKTRLKDGRARYLTASRYIQ